MDKHINADTLREELRRLCDKYNISFGDESKGFGSELAALPDTLPAVKSISGITDTEMEQFNAQAKEMGESVKVTAIEAGQAFEKMAMAGLKTNDVTVKSHGKWIYKDGVFSCSKCGYSFEHEGYTAFFNFCPCCGIVMNERAANQEGAAEE